VLRPVAGFPVRTGAVIVGHKRSRETLYLLSCPIFAPTSFKTMWRAE
jgi:hypothetical protein